MTSSAARRIYDSKAWRKVRLWVLQRDCYICAICGGYGDTVDHDPDIQTLLSHGLDPLDPTYMRTLCRQCHGRHDGQRSPTRHAPRHKAGPNPFDDWLTS